MRGSRGASIPQQGLGDPWVMPATEHELWTQSPQERHGHPPPCPRHCMERSGELGTSARTGLSTNAATAQARAASAWADLVLPRLRRRRRPWSSFTRGPHSCSGPMSASGVGTVWPASTSHARSRPHTVRVHTDQSRKTTAGRRSLTPTRFLPRKHAPPSGGASPGSRAFHTRPTLPGPGVLPQPRLLLPLKALGSPPDSSRLRVPPGNSVRGRDPSASRWPQGTGPNRLPLRQCHRDLRVGCGPGLPGP